MIMIMSITTTVSVSSRKWTPLLLSATTNLNSATLGPTTCRTYNNDDDNNDGVSGDDNNDDDDDDDDDDTVYSDGDGVGIVQDVDLLVVEGYHHLRQHQPGSPPEGMMSMIMSMMMIMR